MKNNYKEVLDVRGRRWPLVSGSCWSDGGDRTQMMEHSAAGMSRAESRNALAAVTRWRERRKKPGVPQGVI